MRQLYSLTAVLVLVSLLSACGLDRSTDNKAASAPAPINPGKSRVSLEWKAPTTRTDTSYLVLTELAGYRIYIGTTASNLAPLIDLNDQYATNYTVEDIDAGSYYFAVTAYDDNGVESGLSNIVLKQAS